MNCEVVFLRLFVSVVTSLALYSLEVLKRSDVATGACPVG